MLLGAPTVSHLLPNYPPDIGIILYIYSRIKAATYVAGRYTALLIPILDNTQLCAQLCTSRVHTRDTSPAGLSSCWQSAEAHTAGGGTTRSGHWCLLPDFQLEARIGCRACEATAETLLSVLGKVFSILIVHVVRLVFAALFLAGLIIPGDFLTPPARGALAALWRRWRYGPHISADLVVRLHVR